MKLLWLHDIPLESGKANVIHALHMCQTFSQLGQDITLAVPAPKGGHGEELVDYASTQMGETIDFQIVPYRKLTIAGRLTVIGGYLGASRLLRDVNVDYVLTTNPTYVNFAVRQGVPTIYESHNSILHNNRLLNRFLSRNLLRNCRRDRLVGFVTISHNLSNFWVKAGVPNEKVLAIHEAVDVENYQDVPDRNSLRIHLDLPTDRKIVAYTGSFYPNREIENILQLAQANPRAYFVLVGGPDANSAKFAKQASQQGIDNIAFPGRVPHARVKDYLFAADVLLMVWSKKVRTINYCSPLKVFEYMAAGRTIVGHGFPTIREVLTDGENALLADPNSFEELKAKVSQAIAMPTNNALAQTARKLAFERYSWKNRASQILSYIHAHNTF